MQQVRRWILLKKTLFEMKKVFEEKKEEEKQLKLKKKIKKMKKEKKELKMKNKFLADQLEIQKKENEKLSDFCNGVMEDFKYVEDQRAELVMQFHETLKQKDNLIAEKEEFEEQIDQLNSTIADQQKIIEDCTIDCSICLEQYVEKDNIAVVRCGHAFCFGCIQNMFHREDGRLWLDQEAHEAFKCPLCRRQWNRSDKVIAVHVTQ